MRYAELQVTTNFSFLRGGSHPHELVATAKALGLAAIAVADRNSLAGVVRAHTAAKEAGLKLIIGVRLDLDDAPSLLCFPTNRAAYGRLCRLLSLGQLRTGKGECTLFLADVAAHAEGQIFIALAPEDWDFREAARKKGQHGAKVFSLGVRRSCHDVPPPSWGRIGGGDGGVPSDVGPCGLLPESREAFHRALPRMKAALAPSTLYLAASHGYRGDDHAHIAALDRLARAFGTPLVATNDVLYHDPARRPLQDVLTAIREGTNIDAAGLRLAANAERHLKSPAEMARLFRGHEDALARTVDIAEACRFSLDELVYEYPDEPVPPGTTPQSHIEALTWDGAKWRFPEGIPAHVSATLERELALIGQLGYAPYFLTVHDIVAFARSRDILCQGRGSAANSAVCYVLGITAVNPVEVDLLFERFVSPERREPPDIDVDFEHERREEVIQYIYRRYGRDRAGLAATVICYRARMAVRDVGKAMGLSEDTVAALAGMVWGWSSGAVPEKHVREAGLDPNDPLLATVLALTGELIGFPRHLSQHVGGFVLTRGPLIEVVPVGNAAMEDRTVIEWDKDDLAALGLLKVDVLALGMLTCIRRAFDLIALHHGRRIGLADVPREDAAVYDMLCRADSLGVFQVESRAQMNMLPRLKPRTFYDLVIEVAIVRPGPIQGDMVHPYLRRRAGVEPEIYPSPAPEHGPKDELRTILGKTKGVPLFQEQAMRIAMVAARFSDAEVNELRKAMATFRHAGTIGRLEGRMVSRMVERGYDPDFATRCFSQIKGFGEYGFPESHAASFALLVYVSAWIKCHYPAAFACALLNSQPMGFYAPAQIVRCAQAHGVEARPVDVSHSDWDCTLEADGLRDAIPPPLRGRLGGGHDGAVSGGVVPPTLALPARGRGPVESPSRTPGSALRLGFRQIDGLQEDEAAKIVEAREWSLRERGSGFHAFALQTLRPRTPLGEVSPKPPPSLFLVQKSGGAGVSPARGVGRQPHSRSDRRARSIQDLWLKSGATHATFEKLAAADAFRSLGLDRRQALWEVSALARAEPLPLFTWAEARDAGAEPEVLLPRMPLSEHVVNDYQTLRLSLKAHPLSFLRDRLAASRIIACDALAGLRDGASVSVAGVVLVRQRPGSANGVVFMTIEDETGIANAVIWAKTLERFRKAVMGARLILIHGRVQRHESIIHVVANRLEDKSEWLALLADGGDVMKTPIANADEVLHPDPGGARRTGHPRWAGHPRAERIVPKSRDFH